MEICLDRSRSFLTRSPHLIGGGSRCSSATARGSMHRKQFVFPKMLLIQNPAAELDRNGSERGLSSVRILVRCLVAIFLLNVVSAALFIGLVNRPVYDDELHLLDVHNYVTHGISTQALLSHRNAPGPLAYMWMTVGVRLLAGNELTGARVAVLMSWILLFVAIIVGARRSQFPGTWYGALLVLLIFPHALEATATVLTEGPALFFAILGVLVWIESGLPTAGTVISFAMAMAGAMMMGLSVTCRQFFLALFPAAVALACFTWREKVPGFRWSLKVLVSLAFGTLPIIAMTLIWKGMSSPEMATGTSYSGWKVAVGMNWVRPLIVIFYTGLYLIPLTFPAMFRLRGSGRQLALLFAFLGGICVGHFEHIILQPGPLNSVIRLASTVHADAFLFDVISIVLIYNVVATLLLAWTGRQYLAKNAPALFGLLFILFFIVEQFGVGGNLPFYDRYVLQLAPFLGIVAFALLPQLTTSRLLAFACLSVFSQYMLWRYAFGV